MRFIFTSGAMLDVPGAIVWRDTSGSVLDAVGFIPSNTTPINFPYGASQTFRIVGGGVGGTGTNIGLQTNYSTKTYTDGLNISGNAAISSVLSDLNTYLTTASSNAPLGPVTVTSQTTTSTTPTVQGTVTLRTGETFSVVINGVAYAGSLVTNCSGQAVTAPYTGPWCVLTSGLTIGTYDVVATITNSTGYTLQDLTARELVIGNANSTYSVLYNGNGNTSGSIPVDGSTYSFGGTVTVLGNTGTLAKTGTFFGGWNTLANGSGAMYSPSNSFSIGANTTLYAYWTNSLYTVTFNSNSGSSVSSQSLAYGGTVVQPTAPTRTGYTFAGWFSDSNLANSFAFSTPITAAITLYAKWTANYTVTFNSNSGSSVSSQSVASGNAAVEPTPPTRTGYTFVGWFSDSNLANSFAFSTSITANTSLYAKWTANNSAPAATTGSASSITKTTVVLNGLVNDNGSTTAVSFDYGVTTSYGSNLAATTNGSVAAGSGSTASSGALTGLNCGTTYHFRAKAVSVSGTVYGADASWTTSACSGSLSGQVTRKKQGTGIYEKVSGVTVTLINASNSNVASTSTDVNGNYSFSNVAVGTYTVAFSTPAGARGVKAGGANTGVSSSRLSGLVVTDGVALTGMDAVVVDPAGVVYDAISRLPLSGAAVWLYQNGSPVLDAQLDTNLGTANGALTGNDGGYSLILNGTATTGAYELRVTAPAGYAFASTLIPANNTAYTPQLGGHTETIQTQSTAPTGTDPTTYYLSFNFTITSSLATTSNGVINNHIPLDPQYAIVTTASPSAGGSVSCTPNPVTHGGNASCTATANTGYMFTGFGGACTGVTCALTAVTSTRSVTAAFAPTFRLTYAGNGNTGGTAPVDASAYVTGSTVTVLGNTGGLSKSGGYNFAGWNTAANGTGTALNSGGTFTLGSANVTLYAQWTLSPTFTVTYWDNGSTGGVVPSDTNNYLSGSTVTVLGNSGTLVKTGSTFVGWNTQANGSGTDYAVGAVFNIGSAVVNLYAQWSSSPTYTVTYNPGTSTGGAVPVDANSYLSGASVTVKGNTGLLVKTGYTFSGWNTDANGSGVFYGGGSTLSLGSANLVLYPKWTANLPSAVTDSATQISFNAATMTGVVNDNGLSTTVSFEYGLTTAYGTAVAATVGGSLTPGVGNTVASADLAGLMCNTTYHYRIKAVSAGGTVYGNDVALMTNACPTYSVTYNGNGNTGGAVPLDGTQYLPGATVSVSGNTGSLVKTGYTFVNWNTAANGSGSIYPVGSNLNMGNAALTLYAQWASNVAPVSSNVQVIGDVQNGLPLTGSYVYNDQNSDLEGISVFRWFKDTLTSGASRQLITGALTSRFTPDVTHEGKYIFFCVTPVAVSGVLTGVEVCSPGVGPVAPEDIDGVSPSTEMGVPSAGGSGTGDGNGDGIPDRLQNHVSSLPASTGNGYATVVSNSLKQLNAVSAQPAPVTLPMSAQAPYGAFQFTAMGVAPNATENFTLYLPYDTRIAGAMKFNRLTQQWDMIGSVSHMGTSKTIISFSLLNGGPYDSDADASNSSILDPIVPVIIAEYAVGGTVSGLASGDVLVLTLNGSETLSITSNGSFAFVTHISAGNSYSVMATSSPNGKTCSVTGGSGTVPAGNVSGIAVTCVVVAAAIPTLSEWALLMLAMGMALLVRFRRRVTSAHFELG